MTYGLILVFEELRSLIVDNDVHGVPVPDWLNGSIALGGVITYPVYRLFISGVCLLVAAIMYWVHGNTRTGMMIRAGARHREQQPTPGLQIPCLSRQFLDLKKVW